jgi:hypothetical protein
MFKLRFPKKDISYWLSRYPDSPDLELENEIVLQVRQRGYFHKHEFERLSYWKSPRTQSRVRQNPPEFIEDVTRIALSTPSERLRIEILNLLNGVNWPTASVVLHFCHTEPYPILDYRALWSLGVEAKSVMPYRFEIWYEYTQFCRNLANKTNVTMRELDRALWQFSKENQ